MPEGYDSMVCKCGGTYSSKTFSAFHSYFDHGLGCEISSLRQKSKIMKQQKVVDVRDCPTKNPKIVEGMKHWKWRKSRGLA